MEGNKYLFEKILSELNKAGILSEIILIGSWVLPVYREYFENAPEIPVLRTTDLDFLISNPPKFRKKCDVSSVLEQLGFELQMSVIDGFGKYIHPDLEIEFMIPELGKGRAKPYKVKELGITAQPLRYMNLFFTFKLMTQYKNITICVPQPAAFALMKFLISIKRKNRAKVEKDISTAIKLTDFLIEIPEQRRLFVDVYNAMPQGWQKKLDPILKRRHPELMRYLKSNSL